MLKTGNEVTLNFIDQNYTKKNKKLIFKQIKECYFIFLVYDVSRKNSFEGIKKLYYEIIDAFGYSKIIYLIGIKLIYMIKI